MLARYAVEIGSGNWTPQSATAAPVLLFQQTRLLSVVMPGPEIPPRGLQLMALPLESTPPAAFPEVHGVGTAVNASAVAECVTVAVPLGTAIVRSPEIVNPPKATPPL